MNAPILLPLAITMASVVYAQEFYPLQESNRWFYHEEYYLGLGDTILVEVLADTVFPNGYRYFQLGDPDIVGGRFVRVDSEYVYYFNEYTGSDQPFFQLRGEVGDTTEVSWGPILYVTLTSIDSAVIFGRSTRVRNYRLDGLLLKEAQLNDFFGPLSSREYEDPPAPWPFITRDLIGCVLSDTAYGYVVSVEDPNPKSHITLPSNRIIQTRSILQRRFSIRFQRPHT